MKYTFIGDIHGKWEIVEEALAKDGKKIFVGDFIDSFDRSLEDHRKCYELVLPAIEKEEAEAIFGNHELSYLMPEFHKCSGWDVGRWGVVQEYKDRINKFFKPFLFLTPEFLVTHAGLSGDLYRGSVEGLEKHLDSLWERRSSKLHNIGRIRGGAARCGGIFWCHFPVEFKPIPGLTQVFGHTRGKKIRQEGNNFCIDCLDYEKSFLEMEFE